MRGDLSVIELTGPKEISHDNMDKDLNGQLAQHIDDKVALIVSNCSDDAESDWDNVMTPKTVPFDLYKREMKREFAIDVTEKAPDKGVTEEYIEEALWAGVYDFVTEWNSLETYKDGLVQKSTITKPLTIGGKQATLWQAVRIVDMLGTKPLDTFLTAYLLGIHTFFDVGVHIASLKPRDPNAKGPVYELLPAVLPPETKAVHKAAQQYTPRVMFADDGSTVVATGCTISYEKPKEKWHTPRKLLNELGISWLDAHIAVENESGDHKIIEDNFYDEYLDTPIKVGYELPVIWAIDDTHMYLSVVTYMGCTRYDRIPCRPSSMIKHLNGNRKIPRIEVD